MISRFAPMSGIIPDCNEIVDYKDVNYGFQFELKKVDEFEGYKNPREEQYDFNVADMK